MSLELFVRGLYTRIAVARYPCFSCAFLFDFVHLCHYFHQQIPVITRIWQDQSINQYCYSNLEVNCKLEK